MKLPQLPKKLSSRRIPTLLGLGILVVALVVGTVVLGQGPGVFAPRATPETTPTNIKVTNVTDNSFTVSFLTTEATSGFVKYGTEPTKLDFQASDDRDQLQGTVGSYPTHHVSVRGIEQDTTYYFEIGTGSGATFNNEGTPFIVKTAKRSGAPPSARTIYGSVTNQAGAPADGFIVYVEIPDTGSMSSLVKSSGSWAIPLSNARTTDGSGYAQITDDTQLHLIVQGTSPSQQQTVSTTVIESQPVEPIAFGAGASTNQANNTETTRGAESETETETPVASESGATETTDNENPTRVEEGSETEPAENQTDIGDVGGGFGDLLEAEEIEAEKQRTVSLTDETTEQTVNSTQPKIEGVAAPSVTVDIVINSETQITQQVIADDNGNFVVDLEQLGQNLEPGEHTATYSYTDPSTGELVTKTVSFNVDPTASSTSSSSSSTGGTSTQIAQATIPSPSPSAQPFGSGNPYPSQSPSSTTSPSPTASTSASPSPSASGSAEATRSSIPATTSGIPKSGSVGATFALVVGGLFFIISGVWSFWIANQLAKEPVRRD